MRGNPTLKGAVLGEMWPTPTVQDAHNDGSASQVGRNSPPLNAAVKMVPTPRATRGGSATETVRMWRTPQANEGTAGGSMPARSPAGGHSVYLRDQIREQDGGQLNPMWVEWLMGFPIGWTDLGASETP